ncbi:MAG: 50S ribosomal protein L15 [Candidatus Omnitrophica bacterium]|nr:50S ribosomal protein L15 [Candidatus Omnitrophota bacterium]
MSAKLLGRKKVTKKPAKSKSAALNKPKQKQKTDILRLVGIHTLRPPKGSHKRRKYLGRGPGSGHGETSTRGSKGQTSRAGRDFYLGLEGGQTPLIRRIPKRGFTSKFKKEYQIVNLVNLSKVKEPAIDLKLLEEKGLIKNKDKLVKILGTGEIKNPIKIQAHAFSKKAAEAIKNAGGETKIINA